ncbi:hypothetical protein EYF80_019113 [Liparis tanakae]|uniref:Uncharacterized protein n=1 Tax=Liparis tanakae TaxID=230148 RepID=A0A4Z2HXS7_9TELE|nr:hypothetical protein EYF80_019113 [Liparis tanakae]
MLVFTETPDAAWLQPRTRPRSRAGSVPAAPSPHTSVSCRAPEAGRSPGGYFLEENTSRRMFSKLEPPPAPPVACFRLWNRKSRSTLSSTVLPCDHQLYLESCCGDTSSPVYSFLTAVVNPSDKAEEGFPGENRVPGCSRGKGPDTELQPRCVILGVVQGATSSAHRSRCVSATPRLQRCNASVRKVGPEDSSAVFWDCDINPSYSQGSAPYLKKPHCRQSRLTPCFRSLCRALPGSENALSWWLGMPEFLSEPPCCWKFGVTQEVGLHQQSEHQAFHPVQVQRHGNQWTLPLVVESSGARRIWYLCRVARNLPTDTSTDLLQNVIAVGFLSPYEVKYRPTSGECFPFERGGSNCCVGGSAKLCDGSGLNTELHDERGPEDTFWGDWEEPVSDGSDSVEGVSDNVLDRRLFLVGVLLCGVVRELKGRKQFETLGVLWEMLHKGDKNSEREDAT